MTNKGEKIAVLEEMNEGPCSSVQQGYIYFFFFHHLSSSTSYKKENRMQKDFSKSSQSNQQLSHPAHFPLWHLLKKLIEGTQDQRWWESTKAL